MRAAFIRKPRSPGGSTPQCGLVRLPAAAVQDDDRDGCDDQQDARSALHRKGFAEDRDADDHGRKRFQGPEDRGQRRPDAFDGLHQRHVRHGRGRKRHPEDAEPRRAVRLDANTARNEAAGNEIQSPQPHHVTGQHRGVDPHGTALAHADNITAVRDDRNGGRDHAQRGISPGEIDVAQRKEHGADDGHADGRKDPYGAFFAEEAHHGQGDGQRIHEMDGRRDAAGDMLVGDDQAQRRGGAEKAQEEYRPQFRPREAETAPGEQRQGTEKQRRDTPTVGQHLERRVAQAEQQQCEERRQPESRRRQGRVENTFGTFHKTGISGGKCRKYCRFTRNFLQFCSDYG